MPALPVRRHAAALLVLVGAALIAAGIKLRAGDRSSSPSRPATQAATARPCPEPDGELPHTDH